MNLLFAHNYAELFSVPVTALRFFTVYGPWGRPDMSPMIFARKILAGEPLEVFNFGKHRRDFTYIGDIVEGVVRVLVKPPVANPAWDAVTASPSSSRSPFRICNIGHSEPVELLYFIELLERALGREAQKTLLPMQPGDVESTYADMSHLEALVGYRPQVSIEEGVERFVSWYRARYTH